MSLRTEPLPTAAEIEARWERIDVLLAKLEARCGTSRPERPALTLIRGGRDT